MRSPSPGALVALALAAGLTIGILARGVSPATLGPFVTVAETAGTLWVNAIRMTVIPLIVSLLIAGIGSPGATSSGALGLRAFAFFYVSLTLVAFGSALLAPPLFTFLTLDPVSVDALRRSAGGAAEIGAAATMPGFRDWLLGVIPTNPIRAAADAALLPLIVFVIAFAFALRRIEDARRLPVVGFFRGVADAMMVLVGWVLVLAPLGVFALGFGLGTRLGASVVGALGFYVAVQSGIVILTALAMYPVASVLGGVPIRRFARAVAPAQVVALSTRTSYAALPAGLDAAKRVLGIPAAVAGFVMPLAVAVFRYTSPVQWVVGALFIAELYGVPFGAVEILTVTVSSVLLNASVPGIPSGGLLVQAPVFAGVGLPVEGIAILIAVDMIPDLFRTAGNATSHLAAATVLNARAGKRGAPNEPVPPPSQTPAELAGV